MRGSKSIGIVAALEDEIAEILLDVQVQKCVVLGARKFWIATHHGAQVVVVLSGIGKVAAAITTSCLIQHFNISHIVFTGVAGAMSSSLHIGDVVVGTSFMQHDMDASPLFPRYVVPGNEGAYFVSDQSAATLLERACSKALAHISEDLGFCQKFKLNLPKVMSGLILSGDQFVSSSITKSKLLQAHPDALAVEMEGAAVAQVCKDFGMSFSVVRTISDAANDDAEHDFSNFLSLVASRYSATIMRFYLTLIAQTY
jgi:adenosylhomocysteine nucleosidase